MPPAALAKIYRGTPRNLSRLARALARGELVAVPTETVYGLAGDALDPRACRKIFQAKGRPADDPLIVHIADLAQLERVAESNAAAQKLARAFWPGPLTLVLPKKTAVPALVTAGQPSVAVRMPRHPLFRRLIRLSGRPLAAPSANPFGYISPTTAAHVRDGLGKKIRHILDGGAAEIGLESTILDLRDPARPAILRPGAIAQKAIERVLRTKLHTAASRPRAAHGPLLAPGTLSRHYSPRTPITLHEQLRPAAEKSVAPDDAFLFVFRPRLARSATALPPNWFWLAQPGDLAGAAHHLFAALRELDHGSWKHVHAELAPGPSALALAINDRLTRAAAKR